MTTWYAYGKAYFIFYLTCIKIQVQKKYFSKKNVCYKMSLSYRKLRNKQIKQTNKI